MAIPKNFDEATHLIVDELAQMASWRWYMATAPQCVEEIELLTDSVVQIDRLRRLYSASGLWKQLGANGIAAAALPGCRDGDLRIWGNLCFKAAGGRAQLVIRKQRDYSHANILAFGLYGVLVRANDKVARLKNLQGKEGVNEPRLDSWRDLAGYSIIAIMLQRGWFELELEQNVRKE
jgi:hypothetical protein